MKLDIPCNIQEDSHHILSILLNNNVPNVTILVDMAGMDKAKQDALKEKFSSCNISFTTKHDNILDEDEEDEIADEESEELNLSNNKTFSVSGDLNLTREEETASKVIEDSDLFHILSSRIQKAKLATMAESYRVKIDLGGQKVKVSGLRKGVEALCNEFAKIKYKTSGYMSSDQARCLKKTNYVRGLVKKYNDTRLRFISEGPGKSRLIIFGRNEADLNECIEKINKVTNRIIILLELTKEHEIDGEIKEILKHLQEKYQKKYEETFKKKGITCEIGKLEISRPVPREAIFFFVKCNEEHFAKIKDYILREIRALCILNLYPKKNCKPVLERPEGILDEKVSVIPLRNDHYLILAKQKNLRTHLKALFSQSSMERDVDYLKLRFKKLPKVDQRSFSVDTTGVTPKSDPYLYTFLIVVLKPKYISDLLIKFDKLLNESNSRSDIEQSQLDITDGNISRQAFAFEEAKVEDRPVIQTPFDEDNQIRDESHESVSLPNGRRQEAPLYNEVNRNRTLYTLDEFEDLYADTVEEGSPEFERIRKLFTQKNSETQVKVISKIFNPDSWKPYTAKRDQYDPNDVAEYLLFYQSEEQPNIHVTEEDPNAIKTHLCEYFDPMQHSSYQSSDGYVIVCHVVLLNKGNNEILSYYPAYCIDFSYDI